MYVQINKKKVKEKPDLVKAKINPDNCKNAAGDVKQDLKDMEVIRVREEMSQEIKFWNTHQLFDNTLFNIVWVHCNDGMQAQLRAHKDFAEAKKYDSIVKLLCVVDQVCFSGEFRIMCDANLWVLTQHRKLLNYTQLKDRDTEPWLKDLADLYDM